MKDKKILEEIYSRKLTGVMYHSDFFIFFKILGFEGFAACQGKRQMEEYAEFLKIGNYYIEKYGCYPDVVGDPVPYNDPFGIKEKEASRIWPDEKKQYVEQIMCDWLDWECSTIEFLSEKMKKIECPHLKKFVYKQYKETVSEIELIKKYIRVLKDHEWCISFMHGMQHHLIEKSKDCMEDACDDIKKAIIPSGKFEAIYAHDEEEEKKESYHHSVGPHQQKFAFVVRR